MGNGHEEEGGDEDEAESQPFIEMAAVDEGGGSQEGNRHENHSA